MRYFRDYTLCPDLQKDGYRQKISFLGAPVLMLFESKIKKFKHALKPKSPCRQDLPGTGE